MDKTQIRAIVVAEKATATGSDSTSDLGKQRSQALDYYLGDLSEHMPVLEGQSKASSSDVSDTIETMLPALMDIFTSGDEYCEFAPVGPEDEEAAQQETDYVNHVFMHENQGFLILYSQIKDALLSKNGIVKAWWQESESVEKETYEGLDEYGYSAIAADTSAEIVQQTEYADEVTGELRWDVVARKSYTNGCFKAAAVPPEEFGIAKRAKDIPGAPYCFHTYRKSASELIEEGYDKAVIDDLPAAGEENTQEGVARDTFQDERGTSALINKAMRLIEVTEHYVRLDVDEDGVAELVKVITAGSGDVLLGDPEEIDRMPFHSITPYPMPHRFIGRSVADLTIDIMRIKTHLLRALLDNASLLNNQRVAVGSDGSDENTLDDLLTNRPGGIVRMKNVDQLRPIPNTQLGGHILPLIEYVDQSRETRTGITRTTGGIDPDVLNKASQTATGFQGLLDQSMMRIKLIARIFAETGIKDLFLHIHELTRKHQDKAKVIRLRNKWVEVDPRAWKTRADMTVNVALGSGSKQQQLILLNAILERQTQAIEFQGGANGPLVTLENVYNTLKRMTELAGFRNVDSYFTEPDPNEEFEQQPDPKMAEIQGKMQLEQARLQMQGQSDQAKAQMAAQQSQADMDLKREEGALRLQLMREEAAAKLQLARDTKQAELELARESKAAEIQLAREQMLVEAELGRERAALDASAKAAVSENRPGGDLSE
jgi:hypothetical protein